MITTRQDSTETLLFTFSVPAGCLYETVGGEWLGLMDGSSYGVGFGLGCPYVTYLAREDERYVNQPSPPTVASACASGVHQSMIEFDPPVRSVEFFYSRHTGAPAWWGGQLVPSVDSMPVYAMSAGFFVLDALTLHSNTSGSAVDTWDSVQLTASSDWISWLRFDGGVIWIDDLKITRSAPPGIECYPNPVTRGNPVTCEVVLPVDAVHGWEFSGTFPGPSGSATVSSASTSTSWSGKAVLSGVVSAEVSMGSADTVSLVGDLEVAPRGWSWDSSSFAYDSTAGLDCGDFGPVYLPGDSLYLAENTRTTNCDTGLYDPSIVSYPDSGYSEAQILDGGPNDSLWYVTEATYFMDRGAVLNPFITPGGYRDTLTHNKDKNDCLGALGTIVVNLFEFNWFCRGDSLNFASFLEGVYKHEGYGSGALNGHQGRNEAAAMNPGWDPHTRAETMVHETAVSLRAVLSTQVWLLDVAASEYGADHNFVNNNWCGKLWILDPGSRYSYSSLKLPNGQCF